MKHSNKVIVVLVFIITLFLGWTIFNGTPWGKKIMRSESEQYLFEKYGDKMRIESVEYDFDNSFYFRYKYYTVAYLKTNPKIKFRINKYNGSLNDNYKLSYWEYEVKSELKQNFNIISSVMFQLRSDQFNEKSDNLERVNLPSYHEIKQKIKENERPELLLRIQTSMEQDDIINTVYEMVMFLKEKDYYLSSIEIVIEDTQKHKSFQYKLNEEDLKGISNRDTLIRKIQ